MYHFHLERKPLRGSHEAIHLFSIHVDTLGREHRIGIADHVVTAATRRALERVLDAGLRELGGKFTSALDPRVGRDTP